MLCRYLGERPAHVLQRQAQGRRSAAAGPVLNGQLPALGHRASQGQPLSLPLSPFGFAHCSGPLRSPSCFQWLLVSHLSPLHLHPCFSQPQFPGILPPCFICLPPRPSFSVSSILLSPHLPLLSFPISLCALVSPYRPPPQSGSLPILPLHTLPSYSALFWLSLCDLHSSFLSCSFHRNLQQGGGGRDRKQTHPSPSLRGFILPSLGGRGGIFSADTQGQHRRLKMASWMYVHTHMRMITKLPMIPA